MAANAEGMRTHSSNADHGSLSSMTFRSTRTVITLVAAILAVSALAPLSSLAPLRPFPAEAAAAPAAVSAPAAQAAAVRSVSPFGMVARLIGNFPRTQTDRELNLVAATGAGWIRVDVPWRYCEPAKGVYTGLVAQTCFNQLDYIVKGAAARGIRVLAVVGEYPSWVNGGQIMWTPPTLANNAEFRSFMQYMAQRYAGRIDHWELGNEVNETEFWNVPPSQSASRYVAFLKEGYAGVKAGNPDALVISAGLAGSDDPYLQELYNDGIKGYFDKLGVHAYTHGRSPYTPASDQEPGCSFDWLPQMKATMERNGDYGKAVWVTEFGWQTSSIGYHVTQAQQALYTYQAYERLYNDFPFVEEMFVFSDRDLGDPHYSYYYYGLMNGSYSPKLAYGAYRRAVDVFAKGAPTGIATSVGIRRSRSAVRIGAASLLSGSVAPTATMGASVVVWVKKPGQAWKISSTRPLSSSHGVPVWSYNYVFKRGLPKGRYYFKAVLATGFGWNGSTSAVTSVKLY
jgi:hypothetical protein